ncbi:hypothetical protein NKL07_24220 [Mesorhizobium sp. C280B]|uniref:hypothetical protein n=2 Tax=Mesorhizobium TaxID=68287 RepID=UPI00040C486B
MQMRHAIIFVLSILSILAVSMPVQKAAALEPERYTVYCADDRIEVSFWDIEQMRCGPAPTFASSRAIQATAALRISPKRILAARGRPAAASGKNLTLGARCGLSVPTLSGRTDVAMLRRQLTRSDHWPSCNRLKSGARWDMGPLLREVSMANTDEGTRVAGVWLAIASILLAGALVGHGPIDPDMGRQMGVITDDPVRWAIIHWVSAVALSLFVLTGLIVLAARSRLTEAWWTLSAWGVLTVGALWTMTTAVAEATVVSAAAAAGDTATFEAWWAFSEGKANGFMFLALAVAVIAGNEAQTTHRATPVWASYIAVVAGIGAFLGWPLGMWLGVTLGSFVWVVASLVMSVWTLWFGLGLARTVIGLRPHNG